MNPVENEFYRNLIATIGISFVIFAFMMKAQKRKQIEADRKFKQTMDLIELRNKKYGGKNESFKET